MITSKKPTTGAVALNHVQRQYLLKQVRAQAFYRLATPEPPVPTKVREAQRRMARDQKIVAAHERRSRQARSKLYRQFDKLRDAARRAAHFGTAEQAITALDKFERFCKKHAK